MSKYEVVWIAEGSALIEADNKEDAAQAFYGAREFYMDAPDSITVDAVDSFEN